MKQPLRLIMLLTLAHSAYGMDASPEDLAAAARTIDSIMSQRRANLIAAAKNKDTSALACLCIELLSPNSQEEYALGNKILDGKVFDKTPELRTPEETTDLCRLAQYRVGHTVLKAKALNDGAVCELAMALVFGRNYFEENLTLAHSVARLAAQRGSSYGSAVQCYVLVCQTREKFLANTHARIAQLDAQLAQFKLSKP